mgnify:CR=1 FL=1
MTDVLILEDELTSLQALSEILTTYSDDIRVHKASSLKEAKDLLDQEIRYGLFLLDVNLSGEDREDIGGILFAREIRERFEYTFTPIVMVTAIGNMEMQAYRLFRKSGLFCISQPPELHTSVGFLYTPLH